MKNLLLSAVFALGGGLVGFIWYKLFGCPDGTCLITSSPVVTTLYMAVIGWLIGGLFLKET